MAQPDTARIHRHLQRVDSVLSVRYYSGNIDTNYIRRPTERLTLKLRFNISGATVEAVGKTEEAAFTSRNHADYKGTLSVAATYRGISLGLSLNPAAIIGKYKDYELNLNSYGNRMGFDVGVLFASYK